MGGLLGTGLNGLCLSLVKLIAQKPSNTLKNFSKNEKLVTRKLEILNQSVISGYLTPNEAKQAGKEVILKLINEIDLPLQLPPQIEEDEQT
ncbi:hypothetical protein [Rippkaea orientalis]|uniref:hypothetical protein n=1 Tax=Rippkaea orientalis TaxID=2546366 RepID=UPI00017234EC|nr:hypothetical protein [Rippkaea orientalis]